MRKIIYSLPSGALCVVHPVLNKHGERKGFTELDAEIRALKKLPREAINPRFVEAAAIPVDRTFRDAWADTGAITVDMPKAREIHKGRLRTLRAPLLKEADIDYMKALENGDRQEQESIAARKQALRDVTDDASITAAKNPDELKQAIPDILKG